MVHGLLDSSDYCEKLHHDAPMPPLKQAKLAALRSLPSGSRQNAAIPVSLAFAKPGDQTACSVILPAQVLGLTGALVQCGGAMLVDLFDPQLATRGSRFHPSENTKGGAFHGSRSAEATTRRSATSTPFGNG
jgi:hypothetical protein